MVTAEEHDPVPVQNIITKMVDVTTTETCFLDKGFKV
jgi:hypothetical protein